MPAGDYYPIREFEGLSLAIMPRPRAGDWLEGEIDQWQREGLGVVVSLLEPAEIDELEIGSEPSLCASRGIDYLSFPIPDRGVPRSVAEFDTFLAPVVGRLRSGAAPTRSRKAQLHSWACVRVVTGEGAGPRRSLR